jgi:hypothetical protein
MTEKATARAREIYPMANEDDYPENPNVNRLNRACVSAFGNGYDYAIKEKDEEIRLHKERIAKLESQYDKLLKYRFPEEDQREEWEAFWNILHNEFGIDYCQEVGVLMKHFKLVRNTQFTQQHEKAKT